MTKTFNKNEIYAYNKGYRVNREGVLLNPDGKTLKGYYKNGYKYYKLRKEEDYTKYAAFKISRLQAYQKYKNDMYHKGIVVRHLNGKRDDDSFDNIAIGTQSQNIMDCPKQDRDKRGYDASRKIVKYSDQLVVKIREEHKSGMSYRKLQKKYNISSGATMWHIIHKRILT